TGLDVALLQDAEVEPGAAVGDQERRDARVVHAKADAVAGDSGLGHLEDGATDPVAVADADLVVGKPLDGEVLAELAVDEVASPEPPLPVPVGVGLVDDPGALPSAVAAEIALAVAVDVEPAHPARPVDGVLEHAGEDGPSLPGHVLRHADVDGHERAHAA